MKCACCMTMKIRGSSTLCEFCDLGRACGSCFDVGATRCSFELDPAEVEQMVSEFFTPWQHRTLNRSYLSLFPYWLSLIYFLRSFLCNWPDYSIVVASPAIVEHGG